MTFRASSFVAALVVAGASGCIEGDPATVAAPREEIRLPEVVHYEPGGEHGRTLVPEGVSYLHLAWTPGPGEKSSYAWGISGGRVLYIYLVDDDDGNDIDHEFQIAIREREKVGALAGHSVAGTTGYGIPKPPTPPGQPEFSQAYAAAVVGAASSTEIATLEMLATISEE